MTGFGTTAQTPAAQGSSSVTFPTSVNLSTPSVGHDASVSSASPSIEMHSITASSLPPQIPGRPGLDATVSANAYDHLVPQRVKDKIWAKEYVELEDQEMELQISSHSAQQTFTLVPKNKKEVNTIARWIKAFNCFTAVYSRKWPEEVPGLLKHMDIVIGLADNNANWRSYEKSFRKLHANGKEKFGQINVDLYLAASRAPFQGASFRSDDNNRDGKSGKGGARDRLGRHPRRFRYKFHDGRGAQDVTTSTDATSTTSLIECLIARRSIQSSAEKEAPIQRPSAPVKPQVLARYLDGYVLVLSDYLIKGFSEGFRME